MGGRKIRLTLNIHPLLSYSILSKVIVSTRERLLSESCWLLVLLNSLLGSAFNVNLVSRSRSNKAMRFIRSLTQARVDQT